MVAVRRGSRARTSPRPETPGGTCARLKPSRSRPRLRTVTVTTASSQCKPHSISPSTLCLIALVSNSLTVSAIGIDSASGSA